MALEPIGSIMTVQAQPVVQQTETKPVSSSTEAATTQTENMAPDNTTLVVEDSQTAGEEGGGQQQNGAQGEQRQASSEQIKQAIEKFNQSAGNSEAIFGIHEGTNRVTIKIVDKESKEVIKELPPEKTLDMIARVWEMAGILVDEKR